jgi:hypothetical protein
MLQNQIIMLQNSFLNSKLKLKCEKRMLYAFYHPKDRKKGAPMIEK